MVRNGAVGINPYDWVLQYQGAMFASHLKLSMVIGTDLAGTVVEVGPDVARFNRLVSSGFNSLLKIHNVTSLRSSSSALYVLLAD